MVEVKREKNREGYVIRGNAVCPVCNSTFEMIEGRNATFIVEDINVVNGKDESMNLEAIAKCNSCEYTSKYNVNLKIK